MSKLQALTIMALCVILGAALMETLRPAFAQEPPVACVCPEPPPCPEKPGMTPEQLEKAQKAQEAIRKAEQ
jgi:hypothetical protein